MVSSINKIFPGIIFCFLIAYSGIYLSDFIGKEILNLKKSPLSPLMLSLIFGLLIGNIFHINNFLLAGIHTSMLWTKENYTNKEWVFTVPSDTPFLPDNLLDKFLEAYDRNIKILIARSNSRHHPVIAMWHISLITSLENELILKNSKIMFWVKKHKYKFVEFDKSQEKNFFNVNTQEEWNTAKNI